MEASLSWHRETAVEVWGLQTLPSSPPSLWADPIHVVALVLLGLP